VKLTKVVHRVVTKKAALLPVRLAGIAACGSLIARLGNHKDVSVKVADMLKANLERMDVDTFHCAVLKSFSTIASAETSINNIESEMNTLEAKIIDDCMDEEATHEAVFQLARLRTLKDLAAAYVLLSLPTFFFHKKKTQVTITITTDTRTRLKLCQTKNSLFNSPHLSMIPQ